MTDIRAWVLSASRNYVPLFSATQCQEIAASADPNRTALEIAWDQGQAAGSQFGFAEARMRAGQDVELPELANPYRTI